nr:hypothetical protein Q903MT_gene139 [Picea sitchensis]
MPTMGMRSSVNKKVWLLRVLTPTNLSDPKLSSHEPVSQSCLITNNFP